MILRREEKRGEKEEKDKMRGRVENREGIKGRDTHKLGNICLREKV